MAVNPLEVRLARLEGSYEQIDRRLGSVEDRLGRIETRIDTLDVKFDSRVDSLASELRREVGGVRDRVHTLLYGVIVAILVPILLRVFFP